MNDFIEKIEKLNIDEYLKADFNKNFDKLSIIRSYIECELDDMNEDQLYDLAKLIDKVKALEIL